MTSKKISLSNFVNPKNKNNAEGKQFSKYIFQLKKNNSYSSLQNSKIQIVFKKDTEIQNKSITEEDEYNEEIYNNPIVTFKFMHNNDNDDNRTQSSSYSSLDKSKKSYIFKRSKYLKNNEKNDKYSIECNADINNYALKDNNIPLNQNAKTLDGENYHFMNLIEIFDKYNKNIKNFTENNLKKKEYKITDKFSRKNKKKRLKINADNLIVAHYKSPSLLNRAINDKKNIGIKANLTDNKTDKKLLKIKPKYNITSKEEEVNSQNSNNLKSITKNLFTKNFELNDNKIDKKIKSSRFHIGLNKKIISDKDINLPVNNNNYNKISNSKIVNSSNNNRKSKSQISEESLDFNNNINKKLELEKKVSSPHDAQNIIIKKKIYLDEELIDKAKISFQKKSFVENSLLNLNNQNKIDTRKNYSSFLNLPIKRGQIKDKNDSDKKNEKYLYSNSNSRNKENNEIRINCNNSNNSNINSSNINNSNVSNSRRRFFINNSSSSQMKEETKKPIINNNIKNIRSIDQEKHRLSNNIDLKKINLDQPKMNESIKIKIDKPLLHSRQKSDQNIFNRHNNSNKPYLIKSITNLNQINNLKKQSMNPQNNIKINLDISQRKQNLINSRSCIFKPEQFKKEYNYNQIILNANLKLNQNRNSIKSFKSPLSQISSARNDEKTTNASKCDEMSTDRSFVTRHIIINRNNGEKNTVNDSRNQNNNSSNANSFKRDLKNITNSNENKNNIDPNNRKIYVKEENHQNNFRRSHRIHEISSVSIDQSLNKKDDAFSSKLKNQFQPKITSTSMDNIRSYRRYKKNDNIEKNNISRIKAYGN